MAFNAINHADQPCDCLPGVMKSTEDDGIARDSEAKKDFPVTTNSGYASFIDESRERIDEIDVQLIELIKKRQEISGSIQLHRLESGGNKSDTSRENDVLGTYRKGLGDKRGAALAMKILEMCRI
ncbi:chorismate mutase [Streptomyces viridosporus]|nr:chorismate mutase [Streptomyces viridosporus]